MYFKGNDVGSINCRMGELLESNIINKKSGADVVLTLDGSVSDTEFMQQKEAAKVINVCFVKHAHLFSQTNVCLPSLNRPSLSGKLCDSVCMFVFDGSHVLLKSILALNCCLKVKQLSSESKI